MWHAALLPIFPYDPFTSLAHRKYDIQYSLPHLKKYVMLLYSKYMILARCGIYLCACKLSDCNDAIPKIYNLAFGHPPPTLPIFLYAVSNAWFHVQKRVQHAPLLEFGTELQILSTHITSLDYA